MERVVALTLLATGLAACAPAPVEHTLGPTTSAARLMSADAGPGFEFASEPRTFEFPGDHGPHRGFQTEWWYVTGHLEDTRGGSYGYQVTFFRRALRPSSGEVATSAWQSDALWMAHATLLEVRSGRFHAYERFEREALELAGAGGQPLTIWVADWSMQGRGSDLFPMRLRAQGGDFAIDLELQLEKPLALHGEGGLSRKGLSPGNASYYYSATRLATDGELSIAGTTHAVTGSSWLDREWSTSALEVDQLGWDWFAIQFDDGRELMLYLLRGADESNSISSSGTLVEVDGTTRGLEHADLDVEVLEHWTSSASGVTYPARWRLRLAREGLDIEVVPLVPDAELRLALRYWEGPVRVSGTGPAGPITGRGFVELVGYGD